MVIPEGKHVGKIAELKQETRGKENYEYLDVWVSIQNLKDSKGNQVTIKYGCPFDLTPNTKLGKLLKKFGCPEEKIKSGESVDIEKFLKKGMNITFMTKDEETDRGTFARIPRWCCCYVL